MTASNWRKVGIFLGGFFLLAGMYIIWDILIYTRQGSADSISWSMALLMYNSPLISFFLGYIFLGIPSCIVVHFVGGQIRPADWDSWQDEIAKNKALQEIIKDQQFKIVALQLEKK